MQAIRPKCPHHRTLEPTGSIRVRSEVPNAATPGGGIQAAAPGQTITIALQGGDVAQIVAANEASSMTGSRITIDGVAVDDTLFAPVGTGAFEVARVPVPDGVHVLDGGDQKFGVVVVGYDQHDSYAYIGGTGTGIINPNPEG